MGALDGAINDRCGGTGSNQVKHPSRLARRTSNQVRRRQAKGESGGYALFLAMSPHTKSTMMAPTTAPMSPAPWPGAYQPIACPR